MVEVITCYQNNRIMLAILDCLNKLNELTTMNEMSDQIVLAIWNILVRIVLFSKSGSLQGIFQLKPSKSHMLKVLKR